ncbi:MAG: pilus assembly protein [Aggregatilineales bacterium]
MFGLFKKTLEILDGTPSEYGPSNKGQSIVEMVFIMPILIILIVGVVEIGWLANNYLTIQEVAKVGARRGTVLTGDNSPLAWEANTDLLNLSILPESRTGGPGTSLDGNNSLEAQREAVRTCVGSDPGASTGFYNIIYCQMLNSLDPLVMDETNGVDDIVISVFAVQTLQNDPFGDLDFENGYGPQIDIDEYEPGWIPVVVGRYPSIANECNKLADRMVNGVLVIGGNADRVERDPFDYYNNNTFPDLVDLDGDLIAETPIELDGWDLPAARELQRGFSIYGQHRVEPVEVEYADGSIEVFDLDCYGSEWSIYDIQERMTVPEFELTVGENVCRDGVCLDTSTDNGQFLPSQGIVLVEMWWQHRLLLNLPVFSPVMTALGDDRTTIYVWSAFPVPAVEPNIQYR